MATCNVERINGNEVNVRLDNGQDSVVFNSLVTSPLIGTANAAYRIYQNSLKPNAIKNINNYPEILKSPTGEPRVFYKSGEFISTSLRQVLRQADSGTIQVGMLDVRNEDFSVETAKKNIDFPSAPVVVQSTRDSLTGVTLRDGNFHTLTTITIEPNTTPMGLMLHSIKNAIVQEEMNIVRGERYLIGEGVNIDEMSGNSLSSMFQLQQNEYATDVISPDGLNFKYSVFDRNTAIVDGQPMSMQDFNREMNLNPSKIANDPNYEVNLYKAASQQGFTFLTESESRTNKETISEDVLKTKIYKALEDLGVSRDSVERYIQKYGDIPVQGAADFTNKIIAFVDGDTNTFTEEAAHFLVEAMEGSQALMNAMADVVNTTEYAEAIKTHLPIYETMYEGALLEEALRKEALGKILTKYLLDQSKPVAERKNLFQNIAETLNNFIEAIRNFLSPNLTINYYQNIQTLNEQITDFLYNENVKSMPNSSINSSLDVLFNVEDMPREFKEMMNKVISLRDRLPVLSKDNADRFGDITPDMMEHDMWASLIQMTGVAEHQVAQLQDDINGTVRKNERPSVESVVTFAQVQDHLFPILTEIQSLLSENYSVSMLNPNEYKRLVNSVQNSINSINRIQGNWSRLWSRESFNDTVGKHLKEVMHWDQQKFDDFMNNTVYATQKDISLIARFAGILGNRKNGLLKIVRRLIGDINAKTIQDTNTKVVPLFEPIMKSGIFKFQKNLIKRKEDGSASEYVMNEIDLPRFYDEQLKANIAIRAKLLGVTEEEYGKLSYEQRRLGAIQKANYEVEMTKWKVDNQEMQMNAEYYQKEADWVKANPDMALGLSYAKNLNKERRRLLDRPEFRYPDGKLNMVAIRKDKSVAAQLRRLEIKRKETMLAYDANGDLKPGLREVTETVDGRNRRVVRTIDLNEAGKTPEELAEISEVKDKVLKSEADLITWGTLRRLELIESNIKAEPTQEFIQRVLDLEGTSVQDAFDFVRYNGAIGFTDQWYNSIDMESSYIERMRSFIAAPENAVNFDANDALLKQYERLNNRLSNLKKLYRSVTNVSEVDFSDNELAQKEVRDLESEMQTIRRKQLPTLESTEIDDSVEKSMNESYYNSLRANGIVEGTEAEIAFLRDHVTDANRDNFVVFRNELNVFKATGAPVRGYTSKYLYEAIRAKGEDNYYIQAQINFLRDKVASYFSRMSPQGFNDLMRDLDGGQVSPSLMLGQGIGTEAYEKYKEILPYVQVNPRYDWIENLFSEDMRNPNYVEGGMYAQPKKSKYVDNAFFDRFGYSKERFLNGESIESMVPTKNVEEYNLLKSLSDIRYMNLENKGMNKQVSKYRMPRISISTLEKYENFFHNPLKVIKELFKDLTSFRVDDTDMPRTASGEVIDPKGNVRGQAGTVIHAIGQVRNVPKYYETALEDDAQQTEDLIRALMLDSQQAFLYKNRTEFETLMLATMNQFGLQNFADGKDYKSTNTWAAAQEFVDANFYGKTYNADMTFPMGDKTIYMSKFFKNMSKYISDTNLMFNPFADIAGMTTSAVARIIRKYEGRLFSSDAYKNGNALAKQMLPKYISQSGNFVKDSELSYIYEAVGVLNASERITDTDYSRGVRLISRSKFAGGKLSNLTNTAPIVLTILDDYRMVGDQFIDHAEFIKLDEIRSLPRAERESRWKAIGDKSLLKLADFKYGIKLKEGVEAKEGEVDRVSMAVYHKISHIVSDTDGVMNREDRTAAQRNPFTSIVFLHKGYAILNMEKRFKGKSTNLSTNMEEMGHYSAVTDMIYNAWKETGTLNPVKIFQRVKEKIKQDEENGVYVSASRYVMAESVASAMLTFIGLGVFAAAADDDHKDIWALQLGAMLYLRTLSELNSVTWFGIKGDISDSIESPFVGFNSIKSLTSLDDLNWDEVKSGKYKGYPNIFKKLMKATVGKRIFDVYHVDQTLDMYLQFNDDTLPFIPKSKSKKSIIDYLFGETTEDVEAD